MMLLWLAAQLLAPPLSPVQIYMRAVSAMSRIADPAYLTFDVHIHTAHGAKATDAWYVDVERASNRQTRVRAADAKHGSGNIVTLPIPPDLFLEHPGPAASSGSNEGLQSGLDSVQNSPRTIASVKAFAVHYTVTQSGTEDIPGCTGALHLALEPEEYPLRYNLRELWVDPQSFHVCRAVAIWKAPVITHDQDVPITLDVNPEGFVTRWSAAVTARMLFSSYAVTQIAKYTTIHAVDAAAWGGTGGR